jgi:hypothetical protein
MIKKGQNRKKKYVQPNREIGNELDSDRFNSNQFKLQEMDSILGGQTGTKRKWPI